MDKQQADFQQNNEQSFETIDFKKFIFKIISNWYWFVLTTFIAVSFTYFVNKYTDPIFSVKSSILIRDKNNSVNSGIDNIVQELNVFARVRRKNVENEIGILQSYTLTRRTIEKLDFKISYFSIGRIRQPEIYKNQPFFVELDTSETNVHGKPIYITLLNKKEYKININGDQSTEQILRFGEEYKSKIHHFTIQKNFKRLDTLLTTEYYFVINDLNTLANRYRSKLKIETSDKKSSILFLSTTGKVIQKEVDYLNKLCDEYIQMDLDEKNNINEKTLVFIDQQLGIITDSLKAVENTLQNFKEANRTLDLSVEGRILFENLESLQKEKAKLNVKKKYYDYLVEYLEERSDPQDIIVPSVMGINDPSLNQLVLRMNDLVSEKNSLSYGSSENNPALKMYDDKILNLKTLLSENIRNIISSNNISIENTNQRIKSIDTEIRKLPITEKKLINIQRKYALNDEIYNYLLQKRAETGIAKASNSAENKILDYSRPDNAAKLSPKEKLNYIIAIIIALLIPLIIIVIIDFFDNKIHERKDIERRSDIPIIAEIGHNNKNSDLVVANYPRSSISESFRKLRTNLKYSLINKQSGPAVISVTSTISGEGKTFTAVNTASVLASLNKKTVILGLDLRKPTLHKYFDYENENGISEYLTKEIEYKDIIRKTNVDNLYAIMAGTIPPNPAELIELPEMEDLIEKLKKEFDYIILDTPPIALVTDALLLSNFVDINLYVVRQNYSNVSILEFLNDVKQKNDINLNIVMNDINLSGYYSYKYNYNYKYGGTYYSHNYYEEDFNLPFAIKIMKKFKR